jgi:hypothetical protein
VTRIGELETVKTSVLPRTTRRNIPEDGIFQSHRHGNLESYIAFCWIL